jgi:hypothetical protein
MKKFQSVVVLMLMLNAASIAQDFKLNNPVYSTSNQNDNVSFNMSVTETFVFSNDDQKNTYGIITLSLGKVPPLSLAPIGNGADLFDWKLVSVSGKKENQVYSWIGTTKNIRIVKGINYVINVPVGKLTGNAVGRLSSEDAILTAQFTDPSSAPAGNESDNLIIVYKNSTGIKSRLIF